MGRLDGRRDLCSHCSGNLHCCGALGSRPRSCQCRVDVRMPESRRIKQCTLIVGMKFIHTVLGTTIAWVFWVPRRYLFHYKMCSTVRNHPVGYWDDDGGRVWWDCLNLTIHAQQSYSGSWIGMQYAIYEL